MNATIHPAWANPARRDRRLASVPVVPDPATAEEVAAFAARWAALTPRQREVLRLRVAGLRRPEIAERIGLTEGTVRGHINRAGKRLDLAGRRLLLRVAYLLGRLDGMGEGG